MILKFLMTTIGFWIVNRSLHRIWHQFGFTHQHFRSLRATILASIVLFGAFTPQKLLLHWLFIGIVLITLKFFPKILAIFIRRELQRSLLPWLDAVVMALQSGVSLRMAAVHAAENFGGWKQTVFVDLAHSIAFSENSFAIKWPFLAAFVTRIIEIEKSGVQCVEQIKAIRRELSMLESFRRRSGQVAMQTRLQAIIVTFLFLGLLLFVVHMFGFQRNLKIIMLSSMMFALGLGWIFLIGRRIKWKT